MPVPSVATSISFHPSSYVFPPSLAHLAESRMTTPANDLVSLSKPPSLTIVDMATLNSLDVNSCRSACMDCKNVLTLPSPENLSVTSGLVIHASNLSSSASNEFSENILREDSTLKTVPLVESHSITVDYQSNVDVDKKQTLNSTSSLVKAKVCEFSDDLGDKMTETLSFDDPLYRSLKSFHETGCEVNKKTGIRRTQSRKYLEKGERISVGSLSIQSNIFHESESNSLSFVKSDQRLQPNNEDVAFEEYTSFSYQRGNTNEYYFDNGVSNGRIININSNSKLTPYHNTIYLQPCNGEVNVLQTDSEPFFKPHKITALSTSCSSEISEQTDDIETIVTCHFQNLAAKTSRSPSDCCSYDQKVVSNHNCWINYNKIGYMLFKSPSFHLFSSGNIAEIVASELYRNSLLMSENAIIRTSEFEAIKMREEKLQTLFTLVMLEAPALSDQTITLDISEMLRNCSSKDLVKQKLAILDLNFPHFNRIKVFSEQNLYGLNGESKSPEREEPKEEVFIKIGSTCFNWKRMTQWNATHKLESLLGINLKGCLSCWIIRLEDQISVHKIALEKNESEGKSIYLGFFLPSFLLHSFNISTSVKRSLSISLRSSRPNQKYSTRTSVDVQFNGNNEDSVPVIPVGIYLPNWNADTNSKLKTSLENISQLETGNMKDIFLTEDEVIANNTNIKVDSKNYFDLGAVNFEIISDDCRLLKTGAQKDETHEINVHKNVLLSKLHLPAKRSRESELCNPLVQCGKENRNSIEDMAITENGFQCLGEYPSLQALNSGLQKSSDLYTTRICERKNIDRMNELLSHTEEPDNFSQGVSHIENLTGFHSVREDSFPMSVKKFEKKKFQHDFRSQRLLKSEPRELTYEDSLQKARYPTVIRGDSILSGLDNGKFLYDLQKRTKKDQIGLATVDTNSQSIKKKFQPKRLEGYCKPFKVSKSKIGIELKRLKKYPDDGVANIREDLNRKLHPSWKLGRLGDSCLSSLSNFITCTMLDSNGKLLENNSRQMNNEKTFGEGHRSNYKMGSASDPLLPRNCEKSSVCENGRQTMKHKFSDKKANWSFLMSSSSTKRSKLTLLIFCLAITSLLISLHALSTDSSLYIKPTFFLVQEDDVSSSSENPYIEAPHYFGKVEWEHFSVDDKSYEKTTDDHQNSKIMGSGINYVKNSVRSAKHSQENGYKISSGNTRDNERNPAENLSKNEKYKELKKSPSRVEVNEDPKQNSNFLKSTSGIHIAMNISSKQGEIKGMDLKASHGENVIGWITNRFKTKIASDGKNNINKNLKDSVTELSESRNEGNSYTSHNANSVKIVDLSKSENQTKFSVEGVEGTSKSGNEFDLNLAFIEKNELNAAYGIDGGTGTDVNVDDYTGDEDMGIIATSGNRVKFPKATRRLPQALIIGVRKGGTRALLEMLHLHPLIQKAAGEAHFFDRDENYAKGLQWYRRRMPPSLKGQITVEKSPSYFVTPEVPERVRAMNASIRLLLIVREPVTRAISDFAQLRSHSLAAKANATSRTKLDVGTEEDYGKKPTRSMSSFESLAILPDGQVDMSWRPISVSLYHRHIAAWLEAFPRDQILIVDGDQLASNPAPVLASVEKFLKLRPALTPTHFYFNATKGFYCLRSLPPGQQVDGMAMLPSSMSQPSSLPEGKCLRESKGRRHPHVDPLVVHKLRRFFAEHNRRFYEMVGEDFGWPEE